MARYINLDKLTARLPLVGADDSGYFVSVADVRMALALAEAETENVIATICNVGDTIYRLHPRHNMVVEWVIIEIIITEYEINYIDDSDNLIKGEDIGKTVFLTEEDAERALAERGGNEHE
jgi:hypothetical protein